MSHRTRMCVVCKELIDAERAEGLPSTILCRRHGAEIEKYGGEYVLRASQEWTSKAGSLKLNFGGVRTKLLTNHQGIEQLIADYRNSRLEA